MISDEHDFIDSLAEQQINEDEALNAHRLEQRDAFIKEAVQKVIEGLSVELDTDYSRSCHGLGLKVTIKFNGDEVTSSWLSIQRIKHDMDL